MEESNKGENVYNLLPRFVTEPEEINYTDKKYLPALVKEIELVNLKFSFVITPARVRSRAGGDKYYYPGFREKLIESALRRLAVEDNADFRSGESTLDLTLTQLMHEINAHGYDAEPKFDRKEADLGIKILGDVKYELLRGTSELYFRPVERLVIREKNGEVYYRLLFSELFLSRTEKFDFCFPNKSKN